MTKTVKSVFETLSAIDVNDHKKDKNRLSYLPWAWAWGEVKKLYPDTSYKVYENQVGLNYHTDGKTAWVKVGVTILDKEVIEYLAIMNHMNKSIPLNTLVSTDVIKTIQRCATKAIGRHGLGFYIYAGEDLPEESGEQNYQQPQATTQSQHQNPAPQVKMISAEQVKLIQTLINKLGDPEGVKKQVYEWMQVDSITKLTADKTQQVIKWLNGGK